METDSPKLTRPGLWPREIPRHTESEVERKVYKALKNSLPGGWYAWHSLRLRTRGRGEFSEADFIIADPNRPGIFILEVKGGQWYQNSVQLKSSPLDQAFSFLKKLVRRFKENDVKVPTIGVALCYPDTFFDQQPAQDDLKGLVIGGQDTSGRDGRRRSRSLGHHRKMGSSNPPAVGVKHGFPISASEAESRRMRIIVCSWTMHRRRSLKTWKKTTGC